MRKYMKTVENLHSLADSFVMLIEQKHGKLTSYKTLNIEDHEDIPILEEIIEDLEIMQLGIRKLKRKLKKEYEELCKEYVTQEPTESERKAFYSRLRNEQS